MQDVFIGRGAELSASLGLLAETCGGAVQEVVGGHGAGKTTFLAWLAAEARNLALPGGQDVHVIQQDMKLYGHGEGLFGGPGHASAADALWMALRNSCEFMLGLAAGQPGEFERFRAVACAALEGEQQVANELSHEQPATIGTDGIIPGLKRPEDADGSAFRIRQLQARVDDAFIAAWTEFTLHRRVLITVDTFELAAGDELGQWLIRMVQRLPATLTVLARTPSDLPLEGTAVLGPVPLPFFGPGEVTSYLMRRLGVTALPADLAQTVHEFTDGHPGGVSLLSDLIVSTQGADIVVCDLRRTLSGLPADRDQRWAELAVLVLEAVCDKDRGTLRRAMEAAAVTATFDEELLAELTGGASHAVRDVISRLAGLRLVQQVTGPDGEPRGQFRLPEFLRLPIAGRLRAHEPQAWERLHAAAAQYHFRQLSRLADHPYACCGGWFRFEERQWQEHKAEWLRHAGLAVGGTDTAGATLRRAQFTLVFLEAFWRWGCYLPFPFMRRLLEDWQGASVWWALPPGSGPRKEGQDPDRLLLEALTCLVNDYPVTHLKPPGAPWTRIRGALLSTRSLCGLKPTGGLAPAIGRQVSARERADLRRLDGLLTVFLAHTFRYRDPDDSRAASLYGSAAAIFAGLADGWPAVRLHFERADLELERADLHVCAGFVGDGAAAAMDLAASADEAEWDRELLANLYRVWADVCWRDGNLDEAARAYGRAVTHAYWLHGEPAITGGGLHGPDDYTQLFYLEITSRAAERVAGLAGRSAELESFAADLWREIPRWAPGPPPAGLDGATSGAIRDMLFPPGPADDELRRMGTPFMNRWSELYRAHEDPAEGLAELIRLASTR